MMVRKLLKPTKPRSEPGEQSQQIDQIVAMARKETDSRAEGYRQQSLGLYPWVCARCSRSFNRENLSELTVHHKDHNHDNNPSDGSNWENLCIYCHDNEHARYVDHLSAGGVKGGGEVEKGATHNPFADLKAMLAKKQPQ